MRRRKLITLIGAAAAWPLVARAQQSGIPIVGYLNGGSPEASANQVAAFRLGLSEAGYVDGRNAAKSNSARPTMTMSGCRNRRPIWYSAAWPSSPWLPARHRQSRPKLRARQFRLCSSAAETRCNWDLSSASTGPAETSRGVTSMNAELGAKRLGLLHELLPGAAPFGILVNPNNPTSDAMVTDVRAAAAAMGRQVEILTASSHTDINAAFASLRHKRVAAVSVSPDTLFFAHRTQLVTLAVYHRVPTIFAFREEAEAGAFMSYGSSITASSHQVGVYTGRILKGENPADLPVQLAAKFEFIINLQLAKLLGIDVPPTLIVRADKVIE